MSETCLPTALLLSQKWILGVDSHVSISSHARRVKCVFAFLKSAFVDGDAYSWKIHFSLKIHFSAVVVLAVAEGAGSLLVRAIEQGFVFVAEHQTGGLAGSGIHLEPGVAVNHAATVKLGFDVE